MSSHSAILSAPVKIFKVTNTQTTQIGSMSQVIISPYSQFGFQMNLTDAQQGNILTIDLSNVLDLRFKSSVSQVSFSFNHQRQTYTIVLVFDNSDDMMRFVHCYTRCSFEIVNQKRASAEDLPEIDRYVAYANMDADEGPSYDDEAYFPQETISTSSRSSDGGRNTLLRFGKSTDNTMVIRDYQDRCDLGLFSGDRSCSFRMKLPNIADTRGNSIIVSDMITTPGDRSLMMIDPSRRTDIFKLDLQRGMVTDSIQTVDSQNVQQPVCAVLQRNGRFGNSDDVFLGFNERNTLVIDPRTSQPVVNHSTYKTVNNFTSGIATRQGHLAMGSKDGIVRLYKEPALTRATVNFQINCGKEPVIAVDVTPDEQWVLATCPYYLAVFNVLAPSTGKLAYVSPMKSEKPPLVRLSLKPQDYQKIASLFGGVMQPFSAGKFEVKGNRVTSIVASIGSAIVSWDFRRIENNYDPQYTIAFISNEQIIDDHVLDKSDDVLFISPNMVSVAERQRKRH